VFLPVSIRVFAAVPNPVLMTNSYVILVELEERCVGFDLKYMSSSLEEFWLTPIYLPLWSPSPVLQLHWILIYQNWSLIGRSLLQMLTLMHCLHRCMLGLQLESSYAWWKVKSEIGPSSGSWQGVQQLEELMWTEAWNVRNEEGLLAVDNLLFEDQRRRKQVGRYGSEEIATHVS
jgi:hypothetical protein